MLAIVVSIGLVACGPGAGDRYTGFGAVPVVEPHPGDTTSSGSGADTGGSSTPTDPGTGTGTSTTPTDTGGSGACLTNGNMWHLRGSHPGTVWDEASGDLNSTDILLEDQFYLLNGGPSTTPSVISIRFHAPSPIINDWTIDFHSGDANTPLAPGNYDNVQRIPINPDLHRPGMMIGNPPDVTGKFVIEELSVAPGGKTLQSFTVSFLQLWGGSPGNWVQGCFHYAVP